MSRVLRAGTRCCIGVLLATLESQADSQPQRDLLVEVRLVDGADSGLAQSERQAFEPPTPSGTTFASNPVQTDMPQSQALRILNGTRGSLHFSRSLPVQWMAAVGGRPPSSSASAGGLGLIVNSVAWLHAGYSLSILPKWPGARAPATVHIELSTDGVGDKVDAEIPSTSNERLETTVVSPLDRWTTFAVLGSSRDAQQRNSWSTAATRTPETQLFQLRVRAP